jgi:hypothetical protein
MDRFQVQIGDLLDLSLSMRVAHKLLRTPEDAEVHFNLMSNNSRVSEKVHGVLGQTYRNTDSQIMKAVKYSQLASLLGHPIQADGETGKGFLEGAVQDYVTSAVTSSDCKFSTF